MSNGLTGGFDAVVWIRLEVVNCLLATLHQNGASEDASPTCPHRITTRIGDPQNSGSIAVSTRGTVRVQVSTPTITLPDGSTSEVILHCDLRAHYEPDDSTALLPEPIHGELQASFSIEQSNSAVNGKRLLEAKLTDDDNKIVFIPAHQNWTRSEIERITTEVRRFLREKLGPINHELPEGFGFLQFKHVSAGGTDAIALPLQLSEGGLGSPNGLSNVPLGAADHFAVAISKEFLAPLLQPLLDSLQKIDLNPKIRLLGITWATYDVKVSTVAVQWKPGAIVFTVRGRATSGAVGFSDYSFEMVQGVKLTLDTDSQLSLEPVGDPSITGLPSSAREDTLEKIVGLRDKALAKAQKEIQKALTRRVTFERGLQTFDASATSKYTEVEILSEGLLLRGTLSAGPRPDVVVHFTKNAAGTAFTAFESWIPAGTVTSYSWTWAIPPPHGALAGGQTVKALDEDRFILPVPETLPHTSQVCLEIRGTRIGSKPGTLQQVTYGTVCEISAPPWMLRPSVATAANMMVVPIFGANAPPDSAVDHSIVAHVDARDTGDLSAEARTNSLIHFTDHEVVSALEIVGEALRGRKPNRAAISVILVLPSGTIGTTRVSMRDRVEALSKELSTPISVTEDYEGGWTRGLKVGARPATYLMNRRGQPLWQQHGPPDVVSLTATLNKLATPAMPVASGLLRLGVKAGERAPDFFFEHDQGRRIAFRKFRGQRVWLNFWKSWSAPCLTELRRLQGVRDHAGQDGPLVFAIDDGEDVQSVARVRQELGLTLPLIPDPDRTIAQRYRVTCWPTTVAVNEAGRVDWVHFGMTPMQ